MKHGKSANCVDDKTLYKAGGIVTDVKDCLEKYPKILFKWFDDNLSEAGSHKSRLLLCTEAVLVAYNNVTYNNF